jgi:pimeloyl-ACP methyl ester carboxylesterase
MARAAANGIEIEYQTHGDGEPLLLVMGLGGQLTDWPDDFVDLLVDQGFAVTVFDNRDSGLSTEFEWEPPTPVRAVLRSIARRPVRSGYHLGDMADDAVGLLDAIGIDSAHVVGMSMGGMIAQSITIAHSHRVRSLTSIMSNTGDRKNGTVPIRTMAKLARRPAPTADDAVDQSVESFRYFSGSAFDADEHRRRAEISVARSFRPQGTARQTAAIMASPDRTLQLNYVTTPTLVLHGLADRLVKPNGGTATARAVPGSRLVMYPDMGHDLPLSRRAEIADEVRRNAERFNPARAGTPVPS